MSRPHQTYMQVPVKNQDSLWETCDTTNDSWSCAWYDKNSKTLGEILHGTSSRPILRKCAGIL